MNWLAGLPAGRYRDWSARTRLDRLAQSSGLFGQAVGGLGRLLDHRGILPGIPPLFEKFNQLGNDHRSCLFHQPVAGIGHDHAFDIVGDQPGLLDQDRA